MIQSSFQQFVAGCALLGCGILAGASMSYLNEARGEVRGTPPPQAFRSGGQLAVPVLKEIAATLHQMDARLARLETAAQKLQAPRGALQNGN